MSRIDSLYYVVRTVSLLICSPSLRRDSLDVEEEPRKKLNVYFVAN